MSFVTNIYALCNKGIVIDITPSFVTICVIWIPRNTYGVYLVLSLKPGATKWYQSYVDCREQAYLENGRLKVPNLF